MTTTAPVETDSPSDRLRQVAEGFQQAATQMTRLRNLLGAAHATDTAEELLAIADEVEAVPSVPESEAPATCGATAPGGRTACDRPPGHQPKGDHSWEAGRQRRIVREYEPEAKAASGLRSQVATLQGQLAKATKTLHGLELEALAMRSRQSNRAKRRAAERG